MMTDDGLTDGVREAGRLLFASPWTFEKGVVDAAGLPFDGLAEIAFAGRSNVGKSSLLNALTNQKGLARTSNTPGRTQELNLFKSSDKTKRLVDMPGYGFAKAPLPAIERWNALIKRYLRGRVELSRVFVLIDSRHGLKANDTEMLDLLDTSAVSYQIVLTKIDKLKPGQRDRMKASTLQAISKRPAAFPFLVSTSSETKDGIDDLRGYAALAMQF